MVLVFDKPINTIVLTSLIVLIMHFLHAGRQHDTLPGTEEPMITIEFITAVFDTYCISRRNFFGSKQLRLL